MVNLRQPGMLRKFCCRCCFWPHDYCVSVDCSTFHTWLRRPRRWSWRPVLLRLQKLLFGRRGLAVLVMTLLLFLLFIIPIALLVNSLVDSSGPVIRAVTSGDLTLPDLARLNSIPVVGAKLYSGWHSLLEMGGSALMAKVRPYIGTTTTGLWVRRHILVAL